MNKDTVCPYCDAWQEIDHDNPATYEEETPHQQECSECGKTFVFYTYILLNYNAQEAPCLNGEKHDMQPFLSTSYPDAKRCKYCGLEERGRLVWPEASS